MTIMNQKREIKGIREKKTTAIKTIVETRVPTITGIEIKISATITPIRTTTMVLRGLFEMSVIIVIRMVHVAMIVRIVSNRVTTITTMQPLPIKWEAVHLTATTIMNEIQMQGLR